MKIVHLKRKITNRIAVGHPWIFINEVEKFEGNPKPGNIVDVHFFDGKFAGKGYFNEQSQIIVRLLTSDKKIEVNEEFFKNKIEECWKYRKQLGYIENCRLVFGEADGLPQLIIDKFNDYFVLQTLALGIDYGNLL
jgi:23S rRNA (cytosine1962-C5)-methyltransferase